ncbi:Cnl2/NKP2 family protein-domain-containing protein [Xylariales sp. PMI_506]|nr:Cnl2/NKP2 family protein-domain-containing protein [Xylariales sp. PMI_506]
MAPSEAAILQNYLLLPARLPTVVSLQEFTSYFPKSQQSSPQIRVLYRDLQQQRNGVVDAVAGNIDAEVKRGKALRRAVAKARREAELDEGIDDEIEIERNLFGSTSNTIPLKKHTLRTILPELESAVDDMEQELRKLEEEEATLLESVKKTVGNMSDLRYGRLANPKLRDEIIDGLTDFKEVCKTTT